MSKIIFTKEQIKKLSNNENVIRCNKTIVYDKGFKIKAVKLYQEQGLGPQRIFIRAGFDLDMIGKEKPSECLRRWNRTYKSKGEQGLRSESRGKNGGKKKIKFRTDKEKIKHLEAQITYLKAENDFLAKLRAKRAE